MLRTDSLSYLESRITDIIEKNICINNKIKDFKYSYDLKSNVNKGQKEFIIEKIKISLDTIIGKVFVTIDEIEYQKGSSIFEWKTEFYLKVIITADAIYGTKLVFNFVSKEIDSSIINEATYKDTKRYNDWNDYKEFIKISELLEFPLMRIAELLIKKEETKNV